MGRHFRTGPGLRFDWWRGLDLNQRPSGYEPEVAVRLDLLECSGVGVSSEIGGGRLP